MHPALIVPGFGNSGRGHWQTLFERSLPGARRVEMPSWTEPVRDEWVAALDAAVDAAPSSPVLVAHSLGCLAVAHWAQDSRRAVHAALLVAPCDPARAGLPPALRDFAPVPLGKLEFRTLLVASSDDPYCSVSRAADFAHGWGAAFRVLGPRGHLNVEAGFGPWPEGEALLREIL